MSPDAPGKRMLVVWAEDGTCFGIPDGVVEAGRIEGERVEEFCRLAEAGDVSEFSGGVVLPYAGDNASYALPRETIARYRVSPERAVELARATEGVVEGYAWLQCPPGFRVVLLPLGGGWATFGVKPTCVKIVELHRAVWAVPP